MSTMPDLAGEVILGVDTHEREHVAALVDELGRLLATRSFPANEHGFRALLAWARGHGLVRRAGVEGTGSFGVGLARFLAEHGPEVFEMTRPSRRSRRHLGKSDTVDAEAAARMVLSGEASATPKPRDGVVESIRVLQLARRSAIKARTKEALGADHSGDAGDLHRPDGRGRADPVRGVRKLVYTTNAIESLTRASGAPSATAATSPTSSPPSRCSTSSRPSSARTGKT